MQYVTVFLLCHGQYNIKHVCSFFSLQNVIPLSDSELEMPPDPESQLQEQEKRIELSCTLATEASRRGRLLSGNAWFCNALISTPIATPRVHAHLGYFFCM